MTDKQIIIDEVKCPWFNDGSCDLFYSDKEECWYRKCKDTPNCYYRETQTQLKAKEQECEGLKEEKQGLIKDWEEKKNLAYEIACKNEKLKQTLTELGTILTHCMQQDICTTCDYSEECNLGDEEIPTYDICKFLLNKINQHQ